MGRELQPLQQRSSSRCLFSPFLFFTRGSSASPMINSPGCKRNLRHTDAASPKVRLRGVERNASNDEASVTYAVPTASAADAGFSVPEPTSVGGGGTVLLGVSANRMDAGDDDMRWPELLIVRNYILECQCVCWFSPFCLSCLDD